jgi:hypothetical protein
MLPSSLALICIWLVAQLQQLPKEAENRSWVSAELRISHAEVGLEGCPIQTLFLLHCLLGNNGRFSYTTMFWQTETGSPYRQKWLPEWMPTCLSPMERNLHVPGVTKNIFHQMRHVQGSSWVFSILFKPSLTLKEMYLNVPSLYVTDSGKIFILTKDR